MALMTAETKQGTVRGITGWDPRVTVFRGVPYARPPVGKLRWRAPEPPAHWDGVRDCAWFAPSAMQDRYFPTTVAGLPAVGRPHPIPGEMSEDCLYLNIWTPAKSPDEKLPVAVYIHGGGAESGYSHQVIFDGEAFARRGVIMVTIAYRLGIFGFFALPELAAEDLHHSTGNYGLMDQIAALRWIKDNISSFGGDPDCVTIFGQSAGGNCVEYLLASPEADGLYRRAIMQSGGGVSVGGISDEHSMDVLLANTRRYLSAVGETDLRRLRQMDGQFLLDRFVEAKGGPGAPFQTALWPCVDGWIIPEYTYRRFRRGKTSADTDVMIGCTADEFRVHGWRMAPEAARELADHMFGSEAEHFLTAVHADEPDRCQPILEDWIGNSMLAADIAWCINQNRLRRKPSYAYYITYVPHGAHGAYHTMELPYIFQTFPRLRRPYTGHDYDLSCALCDLWTNFCKTGDPNLSEHQAGETAADPGAPAKRSAAAGSIAASSAAASAPVWSPWTEDQQEALIIDGQGTGFHMGKIPFNTQADFQVNYVLNTLPV